MKRLALLLAVVVAAPASAADLMVVGRTDTLVAPRTASVKGARVKVGGRRCRLAGRTALAALARTPLALGLRDYGSCGKQPADAGGLYVRSVAGEAERGADGWVYKIGASTPSIGAADVSGRFGASAQVLWFWCEMGASGCQRTLRVSAPHEVDRFGTLRVRVRAYDDLGRAVPAAGARVQAGPVTDTTGSDGFAQLTAPGRPGTLDVVATESGRVRSFPVEVTVR